MQIQLTGMLTMFVLAAQIAAKGPILVAWYEAADCRGSSFETTITKAQPEPGTCFAASDGRTARSVLWSNIGGPGFQLFLSGGPHDMCTNGANFTAPKSAGCETAPPGFNWQSAQYPF
ncbi:hypothetical protein MIND_00774600 [Mycena indigotica]|uniref:Secreted protein n=1 Tax=Mycena indigotica TaxID=2126181 RepID=A0A8H6W7G7_9AGAR|nr:uncharacterized protein MIND_00774600 [Mycena indigotica]KAF7302079.1 hypothetical protein MIND_00774600 [Mycena indigotica]